MLSKNTMKKIIPMVLALIITLAASAIAYHSITAAEESRCRNILSDSAETVSKEIKLRFEDNVNILKLVSDVILHEDNLENYDSIAENINKFQPLTVFSRINVLYPDNTILFQDGSMQETDSCYFEEAVKKGEHMSRRTADPHTGNEVMYYYIPIGNSSEPSAVLIGVVDCISLKNYFSPNIYNGQAVSCIIDSSDGNFVMDHLHDELGNIKTMSQRKQLKGFEDINMTDDVLNSRTGLTAFESKTNGKNSYVYYMPIGIYNWELLIIVQEDIAFASLFQMKRIMIIIGAVEAVILVLYFLWNLYTLRQAAKSKEETAVQLDRAETLIQCVSELSSNSNTDKAINNLLKIINGYFKADRTYIFEINEKCHIAVNTYECVADGVTEEINNLQQVPVSFVQNWIDNFKEKGFYIISDIEDEKSAGRMDIYDLLKAQNIQTLVTVPLERDGEVIGFMGVDNPNHKYEDSSLLSSLRFFVSNSLAAKERQERLRMLSYNDMLTGLYNRNKYIKTVESYTENVLENIGVAYLDLNGLKRTNDQFGHEAGDRLIKNASSEISAVFPNSCYRVGGDEFVIISMDTEKDVFENMIDELKTHSRENRISISVGAMWSDKCDDLKKLLKAADKLMYDDKKKYYENTPYDRRHSYTV